MLRLPDQIKEGTKVIGYFAYGNDRQVICDGDACIIAGSMERMKNYLELMYQDKGVANIKKTRFSEIIEGLRQSGAYAFDEESYQRFLSHMKHNGVDELPETEEVFLGVTEAMHFFCLQII
jgi:hypothetical protein